MSDRKIYSFYKGLFPGDVLNFSKRSPFVKEIMLERIYPRRIILPMKMHYGVPAVPIVKKGDLVKAGQCVGLPEKGAFSVPVHTGVSGKVTDIKEITLPNGIRTPAVYIENDMKRTRLDSLKPRNSLKISATETIGIIRNAGICGMGGEGIPTAAKLARARGKAVSDFLVNCLQSEPYATSDLTAIVEYPDYVVMGAAACARAVGAKNLYFLISSGRKVERSALANSIARAKREFEDLNFEIKLFRERFPQGYYRLVGKALYGKEIEEGETIEDICDAVLFNCSTMLACWEALSDSIPMMNRIISISDGSASGHNVLVPIGTPVSELIANSFSEDSTENSIIWGNCLTGIEIDDPENVPVIKMTSVISVVRKVEIPRTACIHCGLCSECCPVSISPNIVFEMLAQGLGQKASEEGARRCISCGCCSYVCPAGIDLTSAIAEFANRGKVIETNSLLDNKAADLDYSMLPEQDTGEASLLEDYEREEDTEATKDDGSIVLPFDGGKKV